MNEWQCESNGCPSRAQGVGSGVGLRAIGWQVEFNSGTLLCPVHRRDGMPCEQPADGGGVHSAPTFGGCAPCAGSLQAYALTLDWLPPELRAKAEQRREELSAAFRRGRR